MIVIKLLCEHCGFSTEEFIDGYSVQNATYTCAYRNVKTGEIRIVEVTEDELDRQHIDRKSANFYDNLERMFALESEVKIRSASWLDDEKIDVPCPKCDEPSLLKRICGIE